jgi:hypothetical protein
MALADLVRVSVPEELAGEKLTEPLEAVMLVEPAKWSGLVLWKALLSSSAMPSWWEEE